MKNRGLAGLVPAILAIGTTAASAQQPDLSLGQLTWEAGPDSRGIWYVYRMADRFLFLNAISNLDVALRGVGRHEGLRRFSADFFHCSTLSAIMRVDFIAAWLSCA